jgi:trehalose synthase
VEGTPVIAGRAGGIELQMADGAGGQLVSSVEECAAAIVQMVGQPELARELAERGRERVREHFLLPRLLLNELALLAELASERPLEGEEGDGSERDPVCGMAIADAAAAPAATHAGRRYAFCSDYCRLRFSDHPERYLRARVAITGGR